MKRLGLVITALSITASLLAGCDVSKNKTPLLFGTLEDELVALSYEQYVAKIEDKDNFLVFSTPNSPCTCWTSFRDSILMPYRKANNLIVYTVHFSEFFDDDNAKRDSYGLDFISSSQTLGLFKDGVIKENRPYNSTHKIWGSKDSFATYMKELIVFPTIIDINLTKLTNLYAQDSSFTVIYYDDETESTYLRENFLETYARENAGTMNNLYLLDTDVDGIKLKSGVYDENQWQGFKDTYGLSALNNATLGYGTGFVPTAQYVEPNGIDKNGSIIKAQSVYLNDVLTISANPAVYEVTESFYSQERENSLSYLTDFVGDPILVAKAVPAADVDIDGANVTWKHEKAALYHDPLIRAFLDYSLPLATSVLE